MTVAEERVRRCQYQKPGLVFGTVREHAKQTEKSFIALNLVDDDQPTERFQRELRIGQACLVCRVFKIEKGDGTLFALDQLACKRSLANLPCSDETDHGKLVQQFANLGKMLDTWDHNGQYM